jgi:hypothetical protein
MTMGARHGLPPIRLARQRGTKSMLAPDGSELTPPPKPQPDGTEPLCRHHRPLMPAALQISPIVGPTPDLAAAPVDPDDTSTSPIHSTTTA